MILQDVSEGIQAEVLALILHHTIARIRDRMLPLLVSLGSPRRKQALKPSVMPRHFQLAPRGIRRCPVTAAPRIQGHKRLEEAPEPRREELLLNSIVAELKAMLVR